MKIIGSSLALLMLAMTVALADEAPDPAPGAASPWAAVAIFAVVIGMIAGVVIWRRRR